MIKWWNDYITIPFAAQGRDRRGCDCWGLVRLVLLEQKKVELPLYLEYSSPFAKAEVAGLIHKNTNDFVEVQKPQDFDIVVMRMGAFNSHVGIVCGGGKYVLHIRDEVGVSIVRLADVHWSALFESFWRLPA